MLHLLLLHSLIPTLLCSCFIETPWTTVRPLLQLIDPCATIDACEAECLKTSECSAYAFVNAKCALLGGDSGKPQTCSSPNSKCWVRTAACDATTTAAATTTTVNGSFGSACGELLLDAGSIAACGAVCFAPTFNATAVTCNPTGWLFVNGARTTSTNTTCQGNWASNIKAGSKLYCRL